MHKIVVAITGASGSIYAKVLLDKLSSMSTQVSDLAIIMSDNAKEVWKHEIANTEYLEYAKRGTENFHICFYERGDFSAPFASGSGQYDTMIVIPCSMGTLGRIAHGVSDDLITRAADVILKERRKLILAVRDTPYNLMHIKNMELVTLAGGIICPASPSFYSKPQTVESAAGTVVDRVIDLSGLEHDAYRWGNG